MLTHFNAVVKRNTQTQLTNQTKTNQPQTKPGENPTFKCQIIQKPAKHQKEKSQEFLWSSLRPEKPNSIPGIIQLIYCLFFFSLLAWTWCTYSYETLKTHLQNSTFCITVRMCKTNRTTYSPQLWVKGLLHATSKEKPKPPQQTKNRFPTVLPS